MGTVALIIEAARFGTLLTAAAQWCERITLCLAAPRSDHGTAPVWPALLSACAKIDRVIVHDAEHGEGWLLHRLHETSALRLTQGTSSCFADQLLRFERGGEVELFLLRAPLTPSTLREGGGAVIHYRGESSDEFALSFQGLVDLWREASRVPSGSELDALTSAARPPASDGQTSLIDPAALKAVSHRRALLQTVGALFGIDMHAVASECSTSEPSPLNGEVLWRAEASGWQLSLTALSDGVRLDLQDGGSGAPIELIVRTADSTSPGNGLLLTDPQGNIVLAWRGGLLGSSDRKQATLWSQCRLAMLELPVCALGAAAEKPERVAVIARSAAALTAQLATFATEVRRLRELLSPRERQALPPGHSAFITLPSSEQASLVWSQLIGLGALSLDEAVSMAAQGLRDEGRVQYQRLRRDGPLYELLVGLLLAEARIGTRFDQARDGQVRAIQPDLASYTREDWLDCLVNALPEGDALDRAAAMRLIFNYARDTWGLSAQRLRAGGKTEHALKSALNSAIRRGLLRRVGAAYVEKVTANPSGQGGPSQPSGGAAPESAPEPASVPTPASQPASERLPATHPPAEPTPAPDTPAQSADADPLAQRLLDLALPVRTLNWAERRGLTTLRDLVAWHPDAFAEERALGRRSLTDTRLVVEAALGREWEEAWGELDEPKTHPPAGADSDTEAAGALPAPEHSRWNRRFSELSESQRKLPLARVHLPSRMRTYCEQQELQTLGALLSVPRDELLAQPNLGRSSLLQTLAAVDAALHEQEQPDHEDHLLSAWRRLLQRLPSLQRMILVRRSGSYGPRETLESLGETLGLTRERVRQIEARCLDDIRQRSALVEALQQRLNDAFAGGRCIPLKLLLEEDPWWRGVERHPDWVDYVFERLLGGAVHRIVLEQRDQVTTFFARFPQQALHEAQRELVARAEKVPTPARSADYDPLLESAVQQLDPAMREALQVVLEDQLNFDEADAERVLSFGNTKPDRVVALLASQPQPMAVEAVFKALGRCRLPDEVLYFRRGLVGLEQHFPDFRLWLERLVPACLELMAELPPGRQWLVPELHEVLREAGKLPGWLGHWHLASLLRRSGQVQYLGRLRVALPSNGSRTERIHLSDAVLSVLQAAGTPLSFQTIAERVREQTDIQDASLSLLLLSSPFVKLEEDSYGLIERDVTGGSQAIARAVQAVAERLATKQHGLTTHQAHEIANAAAGERWSPEVVLSLLRSEPQLRLSRSGHVGLSSWDDVRAPTRGELIRQQVERAGGRLQISALQALLLELHGRTLERSELSSECYRNQLQLDGDTIVLRLAAEPPATPTSAEPPERRGATQPAEIPPSSDPGLDLAGRVQGLPAAARQHFEELLQLPVQPRGELLERARAHLAEIESAGHYNEFIEVSLARALVERMDRLLERVDVLSPITRRIAQAAVLYFISTEDAEDDFDLGGLEDDEAVLSAVIAHLEPS